MMTGNDSDPGLLISQAAKTYGISREAVRQRIRRGTLSARKEGARWYVQPGIELHEGTVIGTPYASTNTTVEPGHDRELIAALHEEVAFLRRELEARTEELRRRDEFIARLAERLL